MSQASYYGRYEIGKLLRDPSTHLRTIDGMDVVIHRPALGKRKYPDADTSTCVHTKNWLTMMATLNLGIFKTVMVEMSTDG